MVAEYSTYTNQKPTYEDLARENRLLRPKAEKLQRIEQIIKSDKWDSSDKFVQIILDNIYNSIRPEKRSEPVRVILSVLAPKYGLSPATLARKLELLEESGLVEKIITNTRTKSGEPRKELSIIFLPAWKELSKAERGRKRSHGGVRCQQCGSQKTTRRTIVKCADCGYLVRDTTTLISNETETTVNTETGEIIKTVYEPHTEALKPPFALLQDALYTSSYIEQDATAQITLETPTVSDLTPLNLVKSDNEEKNELKGLGVAGNDVATSLNPFYEFLAYEKEKQQEDTLAWVAAGRPAIWDGAEKYAEKADKIKRMDNQRRYLQKNGIKPADKPRAQAAQVSPKQEINIEQDQIPTIQENHAPQRVPTTPSPFSSSPVPMPQDVILFDLSKDDIADHFASLHSVEDIARDAAIYVPGSRYLRIGSKHRTQINPKTNTIYDHEAQQPYNAIQFCAMVTGQDFRQLAQAAAEDLRLCAWSELVKAAQAGQELPDWIRDISTSKALDIYQWFLEQE